MTPNKLVPAVFGGLFLGVLSALPIINIGNVCCCLWVIGGGIVAAYLMQQDHPVPITTGDGAVVGLLAGVFGAVVYTIVSIPVNLLMGPMTQQMLEQFMNAQSDLPPGVAEMFENFGAGQGFAVVAVMVSFVVMLCVGAIFSTLGGLLGALFFRKEAPPQASGQGV